MRIAKRWCKYRNDSIGNNFKYAFVPIYSVSSDMTCNVHGQQNCSTVCIFILIPIFFYFVQYWNSLHGKSDIIWHWFLSLYGELCCIFRRLPTQYCSVWWRERLCEQMAEESTYCDYVKFFTHNPNGGRFVCIKWMLRFGIISITFWWQVTTYTRVSYFIPDYHPGEFIFTCILFASPISETCFSSSQAQQPLPADNS